MAAKFTTQSAGKSIVSALMLAAAMSVSTASIGGEIKPTTSAATPDYGFGFEAFLGASVQQIAQPAPDLSPEQAVNHDVATRNNTREEKAVILSGKSKRNKS